MRTDTLIPVLDFELRASFTIDPPIESAAGAGPTAVHYESAYGTSTRLTFAVLCF